MNGNTAFGAHFEKSGTTQNFAQSALNGMDAGIRGPVVNRTHRVVRERAKMLQQRRSYVRSLMLPLMVSAALLILTVFAVWSGLYQYPATEAAGAVQEAATQTDQSMVMLMWFVPVSLTVLAVIWFARSRRTDGRSTR